MDLHADNIKIKESWTKDSYSFGLDFIFDRLRTSGPYGKMGFKNSPVYLPGDEEKLNIEYDYMERINARINMSRMSLNIVRGVIGEIKNTTGTYDRLINGETLTEVEFYEIKSFNLGVSKLAKTLEKYKYANYSKKLIAPSRKISKLLDPEENNSSTFMIYDSYSPKLKEIRKNINAISSKLDQKKIETSNNLKNEYNISPRNGQKYVIDKNDHDLVERLMQDRRLSYVSEDYLKVRFQINEEYIGLSLFKELAELKVLELLEEDKILVKLSSSLKLLSESIKHNIDALSELDFRISKVILIEAFNLKRPKLIDESTISIKNGRHLKTEHNVKIEKRTYTPINISFERGVSCITGVNMGGKTVSLKMLGQAVIMSQLGFFVPCEYMEFSLRSFVSISSGDSQSVETGLSTFGSEIVNIKEALHDSRENGLILIDELARGTNPVEGTAISKAVIKHLQPRKLISVVTTHFEGVGNMDGVFHYQVTGLKKEVLEALSKETITSLEKIQMVMDYSLIKVDKNAKVPKDAIEIARLLGLDANIIEIAEAFLEEDV
ncbi:MAG: hypothetical protein WBA54_03510 [Acidaminobacteraceae bacterium]